MFNEFPYTNYEKINLDWLLDLGNKLKADAESGVFDGDRGPGIFGITTIYPENNQYYAVNPGGATVGDFIIGYGAAAGVNTLYLMKITSVSGNYLEGTTLLQITGPKGEPGEQGEPGEGGLTEAMKQALLQMARKVVYIDSNGPTYYNALYAAFYGSVPVVVLDSITAVFNQGNTVIYDTDNLDSLKPMLTVTAHYSDNTTATVSSTDYTLSGTLTEGTSTITVNYLNKTDTFNVNVTASSSPELFSLATLTGTVAGTEEVDTGVKMREHATVTIMLTLNEVIGWNWKSQGLFSTGSTSTADTIQLSCSGNGSWSLNLAGGNNLVITPNVFPQTNSNGVKNAPLIVVFENMNTTQITVTAYGYLLNEVVSNTNSFNKALNIGAGNLLLAPTTDHFYNAGSHFGGILTNIRVLDRVPNQAEILAYCEGVDE